MYRPDPKPEPISKLQKQLMKKEKAEGWKALEKKADTLFSTYIRLRDSDEHGFIKCITCTCRKHASQMQCGHFMSRRFYATRWHFFNACGQCAGCNGPKYGMQYEFSIKLDERFGEGTALRMRITSRNIFKKDPMILKIIILDIETRLKELKSERGLK